MTETEITAYFSQPPHAYFTGLVASGVGVGNEVVQIGDRWYLIDLKSDRYKVVSVPVMRPQEDISERPGEGSLSTSGLWRRNISSWHHGGGQTWFDRDDADPFRFRASRGVDPFEQWRLRLLHDTEQVTTEAAGWTSMAVGIFDTDEARLVAAGGNGRCVTIDAALNVTEVVGLTGRAWVASAGATVYVADDTGIYPINAAGTGLDVAFNTNITGAKIWFAKDRLWAADGADLYNVIDGTTTTPHHTIAWPGWEWTSVHEGGEFAYAAGFSGDKGRVFSIGIADDATTLLPPLVALPLPDGELPHSVHGYVGLVAVGTSLGLRVCQPDGPALISGPIVGFDEHEDHTHPVRAIEGQERFLWFGQDDIFTDAAGLGRVDLKQFVQTLAPAYSTDLMGAQTGEVTTVATFDERRWFTVEDVLYRETDDYLPSGFVDSGRITMNITDQKVGVYVDIRHDPLAEGERIEAQITTSSLPLTSVGISALSLSDRPFQVFNINHNRTVWHEVRAILTGPGTTPHLTAVTLAAQPVPDRSLNLFLPLLLYETVHYVDQEFALDVGEEYAFLTELARSQRLIRFQQGGLTHLAFVEDFEWIPHQPTNDGTFFRGTMVVKLKTAEAQR